MAAAAGELEEVREHDPDGRIVVHHRTINTLGKMLLRSSTTSPEMHDANDFQAALIVGNLDPLCADPADAGHWVRAGARQR